MHNHARNPEAMNDFVAKIHDVSTYLGDEVVLAGFGQRKHSGFAMIADVKRSGLKEELQQQFPTANGKLVVLEPASLANVTAVAGPGGFVLVRDREVIFSNDLATLKLVNAQLDAGASGFAQSAFGVQIATAYNRGAGIIVAANLHEMLENGMEKKAQRPDKGRDLEARGLGDVQYLIAEHREIGGVPANHLNL